MNLKISGKVSKNLGKYYFPLFGNVAVPVVTSSIHDMFFQCNMHLEQKIIFSDVQYKTN